MDRRARARTAQGAQTAVYETEFLVGAPAPPRREKLFRYTSVVTIPDVTGNISDGDA